MTTFIHCRSVHLIAAAAMLAICLPSTASGFTTCASVADYVNTHRSFDAKLETVQTLHQAAQLVPPDSEPPDGPCADLLVYRVLWEYPNVAEHLGLSFPDGAEERTAWMVEAAEGYKRFVAWWLDLSVARQNKVIAHYVPDLNLASPDAAPERLRWLRKYVGKGLVSLKAVLVHINDKQSVIETFEEVSQRNAEVFPLEAVNEWHKWLVSLPDFKTTKGVAELRRLVSEQPDAKNHWLVFAKFRRRFIALYPDYAGEWDDGIVA